MGRGGIVKRPNPKLSHSVVTPTHFCELFRYSTRSHAPEHRALGLLEVTWPSSVHVEPAHPVGGPAVNQLPVPLVATP